MSGAPSFSPGDLIKWNGDIYLVVQNFGHCGLVIDRDGDLVVPFLWDTEGVKARQVDHIDSESGRNLWMQSTYYRDQRS